MAKKFIQEDIPAVNNKFDQWYYDDFCYVSFTTPLTDEQIIDVLKWLGFENIGIEGRNF